MFKKNILNIKKFDSKYIIPYFGGERSLDTINYNNKDLFNCYLKELFLPIRYFYVTNIKILTRFTKIIRYFDIPYRFSMNDRLLWRYLAKPFGSFFDKSNKSFFLFFSTGLKKNIGLSMRFFFNHPSVKDHLNVKN
jgi:hypothetical protein